VRPYVASAALACSLAACGGGGGPAGPNLSCNPLGGTGAACLMPWPSSLYLKTDSTTDTGYRVSLPVEAMPVNTDGIAIDPTPFNRWDGFSPSGPIVASFTTGVSADGLPPFTDIGSSLAAGSPVVLLDLDTMQRAPFFAEVDMNAPDPTQRSLIIRPMIRLQPKHHYGVAVRTAVKAADGSALPISPAFAAMLAGQPAPSDAPLLAGHEQDFQDLFTKLEAAGVPRTDLVIAWDFRTASDEYLTSDLLTMRGAAIPAIGTNGANLTFTATPSSVSNPDVHALYTGTFKSPNFLSNGENLGSLIVRDGNAKPMMMGMRDANFAAVIPSCTTSLPGPVPVMVFGHGLFGSAAGYIDDSKLQSIANEFCFVIVAGDWIGLTQRQLELAANAANDFNQSGSLAEMLEQSIIDFIALEQIVRGPMKDAPEFQVNGHSVIDPTQVYYLGGSLGGIMGNTFMAYDPNILRGGLGVPGGAWSLMFERSQAWSLLQGPAESSYTNFYEAQNLIAFLGMRMEPVDPVTTATHVLSDPLPNTPAKHVDMYEGIGDCLVTNLSTEMMARTMKINVVGPSLKMPWGLTVSTAPQMDALTIYDEHKTPLPPTTNVPPATDNGTHSGVNFRAAVLRQVHDFLLQGTIANQCLQGDTPSPCDCATGVCDGTP
jgi:hypothetical protein